MMENKICQISFYDGNMMIIAGNEALRFHSRLYVEDSWIAVSYRDEAIAGVPGLNVTWHSEIHPEGVILRAVLQNFGKTSLTLGAFHLLESSDSLPGTAYDDAILIDSAGGWFAGAVRVTASCQSYMEYWNTHYLTEEDIAWAREIQGDLKSGAHYSLGGLLAYQRRNKDLPAWIFSFVAPMKRCSAVPIMLADPATGAIRSMALSNNFAGYILAPGEQIDTEEVLIGCNDNPHIALEEWALFCAKRRNVKVQKQPPVGWLSWYGYRLDQNETDTIRTADLIKNKLDGLDFKYIQLDLGYNKNNLPGDWFEVNDHFAEGLLALAKKISARGFKFGIWVCPFLVAADSTFAKEHPEALLPIHPNDSKKWFWEPYCELFQLDPTHPEGEKFLRRIVTYFKSIGVSYFKFDFCGRMGRVDKDFVPFDRKTVKGVELYRHGLKILMEMMDKDDYVYWCSNLLHFGLGLGDTSMTACDISNTGFSQARQVEGRTEDINYFRSQANTVISRYYLHQKLLLLNADAINLAPPADIEECRIRASMVAMSGGQVFLGDRFDLCEDDRYKIIKQVCPPYGQAARPIDLFEHVYPESYPHIWHLHVTTGWDEREIVTLMHLDSDKTVKVALGQLGLPSDTRCHLWEFWTRQYLGCVSTEFSLELPYPSVRVIAAVPERNHPWVLSTSFHISQGGVELTDVKWDEVSLTLSGNLIRPKGMNGEILVMTSNNYICSLEQLAPGIYTLPLTGNGNELKWEIHFVRSVRSNEECKSD